MSSFDSLTLACEGWFDKPLCDLPEALRQRIDDDFWPMPWDRLTARGRRSVTQQIDYSTDPAKERLRRFSLDISERRISITTQIEQWEAVATPTALDLAQKETRLVELREDLASLEAEFFEDDDPIECPRNLAEPTKRKTGSEHLPGLAETTAAGKPHGSTVRRDVGKLDTLALHKQWQKAYRAIKKARPNMSDVWYSQQIAKMEFPKKRSAETIRKHMKS